MSLKIQAALQPSGAIPKPAQPNILNFIRLFLAIAVIFSHSWPLLLGSEYLDPLARLLHNQPDLMGDHPMDTGHIAVYCFFVISGYLISMSFQRSRNVGDYLKKRVLRIYPGFLVAVFACLLLFGTLGADDTRIYRHELAHSKKVVLHALFLKVEVNDPPFPDTLSHVPISHAVNGSTWTIQYEFMAYLMVALLGSVATTPLKKLPLFAKLLCPVSLFLAVYTVYVGDVYGHSGSLIALLSKIGAPASCAQIPRLFVYFVAGMCFYAYRRWVPSNPLFLCLAAGVLVVSAVTPPLLPLTFPIFGSYILLAVGLTNIKGLAVIGTRRDLSYGVYLYAFPIQQLLVMYAGKHLTPFLLFLIASPLALLLAWLSWTVVEEPALRLKGRRKDKKGMASTTLPAASLPAAFLPTEMGTAQKSAEET